jgi:sucrose synthase
MSQYFRYVSKGRRLLKNQQLIEELEKSLDDKVEKEKLVEGFLGYIICSTQVISSHLDIFCSKH